MSEFNDAMAYRTCGNRQPQKEFYDLWAACPFNKSFALTGQVLSTVYGKANRYGKKLGCKFQVNSMPDGSIVISKFELSLEEKARLERKEKMNKKGKHQEREEVREFNLREQQDSPYEPEEERRPAPWDHIQIDPTIKTPWNNPVKQVEEEKESFGDRIDRLTRERNEKERFEQEKIDKGWAQSPGMMFEVPPLDKMDEE